MSVRGTLSTEPPPRFHGLASRPFHSRAPVIFPALLSFLVQVPASVIMVDHGGVEFRQPNLLAGIFQVALAAAGPLLLLAARKYPGPVIAGISVLAAIDLFVGDPAAGPPYVAFVFAVVGAVVRGARLWAWIAVALAGLGCFIVASFVAVDMPPVRLAAFSFGVIVLLGVGEAIRNRKDRIASLRRLAIERRQQDLQAERVRIARELHDVLAHSLGQINVQAAVGLHLMDSQPGQARSALASIKESSKTALDEVRSVLGILRSDADGAAPLVPEPDLAQLPSLIASFTAGGLQVDVGEAPTDIPPTTQLALFRIIQESLTNVARHSGATRVLVDFTGDAHRYIVSVSDNGSAAVGDHIVEGRGLLGMRERTELLGGTLDVGAQQSGGFRVVAQVPRSAVGARQTDTP